MGGSTHAIGNAKEFIVSDGRGLVREEVFSAMALHFEHGLKVL